MCSSCCGSSTRSLNSHFLYKLIYPSLKFSSIPIPHLIDSTTTAFPNQFQRGLSLTPPLFFSARYIPFPKPSFFLFLVFVFVGPTLTTAILIPDLVFFFLFHFLVDSNSCLYFNSNNLDYSTFSRLREKLLCFVC